jgi:hypothetical protein
MDFVSKYPNTNDELMKEAVMSWVTDVYGGDETAAKTFLKMQLAVAELRERGFSWTDL